MGNHHSLHPQGHEPAHYRVTFGPPYTQVGGIWTAEYGSPYRSALVFPESGNLTFGVAGTERHLTSPRHLDLYVGDDNHEFLESLCIWRTTSATFLPSKLVDWTVASDVAYPPSFLGSGEFLEHTHGRISAPFAERKLKPLRVPIGEFPELRVWHMRTVMMSWTGMVESSCIHHEDTAIGGYLNATVEWSPIPTNHCTFKHSSGSYSWGWIDWLNRLFRYEYLRNSVAVDGVGILSNRQVIRTTLTLLEGTGPCEHYPHIWDETFKPPAKPRMLSSEDYYQQEGSEAQAARAGFMATPHSDGEGEGDISSWIPLHESLMGAAATDGSNEGIQLPEPKEGLHLRH